MFNIDEVFEMAEQIERDGARFYRQAAENTNDEEGKKLLLDLARMEDEHEVVFAKLRNRLASADWGDRSFDPDGEAASYIRSFASGKVFDLRTDMGNSLTGGESISDLLKIALHFERETIAFFTGIQEIVPEDLGKDKVSKIIHEEMGHVTLISRRLERYEQGA